MRACVCRWCARDHKTAAHNRPDHASERKTASQCPTASHDIRGFRSGSVRLCWPCEVHGVAAKPRVAKLEGRFGIFSSATSLVAVHTHLLQPAQGQQACKRRHRQPTSHRTTHIHPHRKAINISELACTRALASDPSRTRLPRYYCTSTTCVAFWHAQPAGQSGRHCA